MRWLKWAALAFGAGVALLAAAALALRVLFPPEKVKEIALQKISASLGREVRLQSAVLGLRGVKLEGLAVSEAPDFAAGTALKAAQVRASVRLWPLIARREFLSDEISVQDFEVSYFERGASPAPRAPAEGSPSAPSAGKAAAGAALSVGKVSLEGGKVLFRSLDGTEVMLSQAALSASGVRLDGPVPYSLSFFFSVKSGGAAHSGRLSAQGEVDPAGSDMQKASLTLKPLSVTVDGLVGKADGRVDGLKEPRLEFELQLPALTRGNTPALAPLPEGFAVPALSGPLKASFGPNGLALESLSLKGEGAAAELRAVQKGTRWDIPKARVSWGPISLSASGTADTGGKGGPNIDLKLRLAPMSLAKAAELVPGATAYAASGTFSAEVSAKGAASDPALAGTVTLENAAATLEGQKLRGVEASLKLTPDTAAGRLKGLLNDSPFDAKLEGNSLRRSPDIRIDARLDRLDLASLPSGGPAQKPAQEKKAQKPAAAAKQRATAGKPFKAAGTLTIGAVKHPNFEASGAKLSFDLRGAGDDPALLEGTAAMHVGAGRFTDLKLLGSGKPILKALLLPVILLQKAGALVKLPFFPSFDTFSFSEIRGAYAVKDGVLTIKESKVDGSTADAEVSGTANLLTDAVDMRAKVVIAGKTFALRIDGTTAAPTPHIDMNSMLKQPAVDKAVGEVLKQGQNLLKGLFK